LGQWESTLEALIKPRLLVIGGTGFIGHHLLTATKNDWQVTSISLSSPTRQRFVDSVRYIQLDLTDLDAVKNYLTEDYEYVVNLGGYIDHTLFIDGGWRVINEHFLSLQNLIGMLSRKSLKRFVHIGSSDEYGNLPSPQHEELREEPISPYSFAKLANAHLLQMLYRTERFPAVILRLFLTYGPYQDEKRFLPQVIKACLRGDEFAASEGEQLRDFCYVQDVVRAIVAALQTNDIEGHILNIASGVPISIRSMINLVQNIVGGGKPQYGSIPYRVGENMRLYANIQKAQRILGWNPEISLEKGLRETIESVEKADV